MKLAFYRADRGRLYQKLIAWITRPGPYCHVEIVFPQWDGRLLPGMEIMQHDPGGTLCFSASEQDGGTRFKIIDLADGKWDLIDVPWNADLSLDWCVRHQRIQYDFWGLRGFILHRDEGSRTKMWCSECAARNGRALGYLAGVDPQISPNALARQRLDR